MDEFLTTEELCQRIKYKKTEYLQSNSQGSLRDRKTLCKTDTEKDLVQMVGDPGLAS
jgi:hypothetical protein